MKNTEMFQDIIKTVRLDNLEIRWHKNDIYIAIYNENKISEELAISADNFVKLLKLLSIIK